jgi:hypothetical protein
MRSILLILAAAALAGCGVETASTAATAAALKKQEVEQGKRTLQRAEERIGKSMEQMHRSAAARGSDQ